MSHRIDRYRRVGLLLVLAALSSGCATRGDLREIQYEMRRLAVRQDSAFQALMRMMERENAQALDSVAELASLMFEFRGEVNNRLLAIQNQQLVMGELVGQSQHSLALMTEELNRQRQQIELVSRQEPADTLAGGDEEGEEPSGAQFVDADEEAYQSLMQLVDRGLTGSARRGLELFLEEYPNSGYAPAAYLHLAEMRVLDDDLEHAIETYLMVPDLFPEADEVPRALYQAGLLCIAIDDSARAREYLQWLVDSYPDHVLAARARDELDKIS